jgi:hypothetical protein
MKETKKTTTIRNAARSIKGLENIYCCIVVHEQYKKRMFV